MKRSYSFVMVYFIALTGQAQLVLNENFSGFVNGNLNGQAHWESEHTGNDVVVNNANPLFYARYPCGEQYISMDTVSGKDPYKAFSAKIQTTTNKTVFMSFVVRVRDVVISNTSYFTLVLRDTFCLTPNVACRFYVQKEYSPSNDIQFGIAVGSGSASFTTTAASWAKNTTYLIVIRYDIVSGGADKAYLWVNPSLANEPSPELVNTPSFAISTTGEVDYGVEWNALQLFQSGINTPAADFDAFRIAEGPTSNLAWDNLGIQSDDPAPVQQHISLSPNPVRDALMVQYPMAEVEGHIQVINAAGVLVKDLRLSANSTFSKIDFSALASGLYYVVFKSGSTKFIRTVFKN